MNLYFINFFLLYTQHNILSALNIAILYHVHYSYLYLVIQRKYQFIESKYMYFKTIVAYDINVNLSWK